MNVRDRLSSLGSGSSPRTQRLLNRALLFAGGLLVLWVMVQLLPTPQFGDEAPVRAEQAAAASERLDGAAASEGLRLVTPGRIAALFLLAGGAAFAYYLHRRQQGTDKRTGTPIEPLGSFSFAPNQQLRLVACGGEVLLLGVTAQQITLLKSYARDDFEALPSGDTSAGHAAPPAFAELLQGYASRTTNT